MENDRVSSENLESSEPINSQNLCLNVEASDDGHILSGDASIVSCPIFALPIRTAFEVKCCLPTVDLGDHSSNDRHRKRR